MKFEELIEELVELNRALKEITDDLRKEISVGLPDRFSCFTKTEIETLYKSMSEGPCPWDTEEQIKLHLEVSDVYKKVNR